MLRLLATCIQVLEKANTQIALLESAITVATNVRKRSVRLDGGDVTYDFCAKVINDIGSHLEEAIDVTSLVKARLR